MGSKFTLSWVKSTDLSSKSSVCMWSLICWIVALQIQVFVEQYNTLLNLRIQKRAVQELVLCQYQPDSIAWIWCIECGWKFCVGSLKCTDHFQYRGCASQHWWNLKQIRIPSSPFLFMHRTNTQTPLDRINN